jgi:hypothetical protein
MGPEVEAKRRLLRAGLVGRGPRSRPRAEGEVVAMARMARERWRAAVRDGEIRIVPGGYVWEPRSP